MSVKTKLLLSWVTIILVLDQLTKFIVDRTMPLHQSIPVIDDLFSLTYIRNTGAAFGYITQVSDDPTRVSGLVLQADSNNARIATLPICPPALLRPGV